MDLVLDERDSVDLLDTTLPCQEEQRALPFAGKLKVHVVNKEITLAANEPIAVIVDITNLVRGFAGEFMRDLHALLEFVCEPVVLPDEHPPLDIIAAPFHDPKIVEEGMIGAGIPPRYP